MTDRYSVDSLMLAMRELLLGAAPILDRVGVRHRPAEATYDAWEDFEAQVFKSLVGDPLELAGAAPLARYGFHPESFAGMSFVQVGHGFGETVALVGFCSRVNSFDTLLGARLDPDTLAVVGSVDVRFDGASMKLCANKQGASHSFEYLSY